MGIGSRWLLALAALTIGFSLTSCTQVPDGGSRVRIQLPAKSSSILSSRPTAASTDGSSGKSWGLSSLSATSDISCYAVAYGGVDTLRADRCLNNAGAELLKINGMSESGVPGSEISLLVPAGSARRFYLFAFKAKPGASCPNLTSGAHIDPSRYSAPSLIGMKEADIAAGSAEVEIIASLTGAREVDNCGWEFDSPTATPTPAPSLSLALADSTTTVTTHARQRILNVSIAEDSTASRWCMSESQTTAPASGLDTCSGGAGTANGWLTTRPATFSISAGDGAKTVYLWIADSSGSVSSMSASASIALDTLAPSAPVVSLASPATGSTAYTNTAVTSLNISSDSEAVSWCALEQASSATPPSTPARTSACFVPLKPTTASLGATGTRKVYLYIQDAAGNTSSSAAVATIDYQNAAPAVPTLALSDPTTGSTSAVRQPTVATSIGGDSGIVRWCLSATQATRPSSGTDLCVGGAGPGDGWLTARPTSSSLSAGDGVKTLNLWVADAYNNVSATAATSSIALDATAPAVPTVSLSDPSTASTSYTNASIVNLTVTGDTGATNWCMIEQSSSATAPSIPLYNNGCFVSTRPTVITLGALGVRRIYLYTQDASGNVAPSAATATIDYQNTAPSTPTLALVDPTTNSSLYIRQTLVNLAIGNDTLASKWCVSQTQTSKPASGTSACSGGTGPMAGWYTSRPTNFNVAAGDGTKVIYLWVANDYNNVSASPVSATINMDTVALGAPVISLADPLTNSASTTNLVNINLSVSGDSGAAKWCLKTLSDVATAVTPLFNDVCWTPSRPTSVDLAGDGNRKAYLYLKDAAENVSSPGTAIITKTTLSKLAVLGATHIHAGNCVPYRIVGSDSSGEPTQASANTTVTLTASGGPSLYSDAACTSTISTLTVPKGSMVEKFFAKQATAANSTISASGSSLTAGSLAINAYTMPAQSVIEIAGGERFTCFLLADFTVKCSGSTVGSGILGSDDNSSTPVLINGLTGVKNLVAGADFACALLSAGTVKCWGGNKIGQLGTGNMTSSPTPLTVSGITTAVQLSSSDQHVCALLADNSVKCWGSNEHGETGDGTTTNRTTPGPAVPGLGSVVQVVAGRGFSCAVLAEGTVKCWGYNGEGNLGVGATSADSFTPVRVSSINSVVGLSAAYHACALFAGGTVKCWGPNWSGQLGLNHQTNQSSPIAPATALTNVMSIAAFPVHTCVVMRDGTAKCTGANYTGQLGNGSTTLSNVFVSVSAATGLIQIAGSSTQFHTCARKQNGASVCWGSSALGETGDGIDRDVQYPIAIATGATGFSGLGSGAQHMCGIFGSGTPATAKCWGGDLPQRDPLGNGASSQSASPIAVNFGGSTGVTSIRGGNLHNCALFSDGAVRCWGENRRGQIGSAYFSEKVSNPSFTTLTSSTPVSQIDAGGATSCAVLSSGALKCWGANESGQLGDTTVVDRNVPTSVTGLTSGVAGVAVGEHHACAWLTDGSAKCWGNNTSGQLGNGSTTGSSSPVSVTSLSGVTKMVAGAAHTCALVSGGYVKCWGSNIVGSIGDGTFADRLVPTTVSNISSISSLSTKFETTCAMTSGGTVYCWGRNGSYQVTETNKVHQNVPVLVAGIGSTVSQIAVGMENVCVLTTGTPTVKCWGANGRQQSGQPNTTFTGLLYAP